MSKTQSLTRAAAACLLATVVAGCAEPLAPTGVSGVYALVRVGSAPIPASTSLPTDGEIRIVYDTIELRTDGTARSHLRYEVREAPLSTPVGHEQRLEGSYRLAAGEVRVHLYASCPSGVICMGSTRRRLRVLGRSLMASDRDVGALLYVRTPSAAP